jgi:RHS repeat-associated protein
MPGDAFGRRVKKIASGVTTLYHYAGGNLIAETDENGVTLRDYIYFNGEPVALKIYGTQFGTMYYFVNDHLGTPQKIVSSSGRVVWAAGYFPFGKAQIKPKTVTNNLRFPGQYFDAESGLHYNRNRYYDSDTGRYITADPIGLEGGINLYSYVLNNPMNWVDPSGLEVWMCYRKLKDFDSIGSTAFHQYICYDNPTKPEITCGSTTPTGAGYWSPGRPTTPADGDVYRPPGSGDGGCGEQNDDDGNCMEKCIHDILSKPTRPQYGWPGPGADCKEFSNETYSGCFKKCGLKDAGNDITPP